MHVCRAASSDDVALLAAPLDRVLFYPAANALFRAIRRLPITPNQVTVLHLALGLSTFWWLAKPSGSQPVVAVAIYFVRNVLDCLDGVIARARDMTSPAGRVLDEWSDALSATALIAGVGVAAWRQAPAWWVPPLAALAVVATAILALQCEFGRRRIAHALTTGQDCVWPDYEVAERQRRSSVAGWLGHLADTSKIVMNGASRNPERLAAEARFLHERAGSPSQRRLLRMVSLGAGDNAILILLAFVLADRGTAGLAAAITYSAVLSITNLTLLTRHLSKVPGATPGRRD